MIAFKIALKYLFSKTKGSRFSAVFISIGIAVGLAALLIVIAVMNGLQSRQIELYKNLQTFDLVIENFNYDFENLSSDFGILASDSKNFGRDFNSGDSGRDFKNSERDSEGFVNAAGDFDINFTKTSVVISDGNPDKNFYANSDSKDADTKGVYTKFSENTKIGLPREEYLQKIKQIDGVQNAFYFADADVLLTNTTNGKSRTAKVRAIDRDVYSDSDYISFTGKEKNVISYEVARNISLHGGDVLQIMYLRRGRTKLLTPFNRTYEKYSYYISSLPSFDGEFVFIPLDEYESIFGNEGVKIGIYANGNLKKIKRELNTILHAEKNQTKITDWKENNATLYSALIFEKVTVSVFLIVICAVICINLRNSTARLIQSKQKEGGILRALGMSEISVNSIFVIYGLLITATGELFGIILGKLCIIHFDIISSFADKISSAFGSGFFLSASMFNPKISFSEIILFATIVFFTSLFFIYKGSKRIFKTDVMEIILNATD